MEKIKALLIFEMIGRPVEHLNNVIADLITTLGTEKGIRILNKKIHEAKKVDRKDKEGKIIKISENQQLYSTFSEVEIETDKLADLIAISLKYMPSNIEIIAPMKVSFESFELNYIMNDLLVKLHNFDSIAKSSILQNQMLAQKLQEMMNNQETEEDSDAENTKDEKKD